MLQNREERMQVLVSISIVVLFICSNTPAALNIYIARATALDGHLGYQVATTHPISSGCYEQSDLFQT